MALLAFRNLLRSARIAFQDDKRLLRAAWQQSRDAFRSNASLSLDDPRVLSGIKQAESIAKILRENVVQGKSVGGNTYRLRIHEHTERGDNDTVRMSNGKASVRDCKTCVVT